MTRTPHAAVLALTLLLGLALTACGGDAAGQDRPPAPSGVTAQATSSSTVHVMWHRADPAAGVTGYTVHRDGAEAESVGAETYMVDIAGLDPATAYDFTVRATGPAGRSGESRAVTATTFGAETDDDEPPTAPGALTGAADGPRAAELSWEAAEDNVAVTGYEIHQSGTAIHSVPAEETTTLVTGLRPGTDYVFTVVARDAGDNTSEPGPELRLTTPGAGDAEESGTATAPAGLTARPGEEPATLELSWTPPRTGAAVLEYQIHLDGEFTTTLLWGAEAPDGEITHLLTVDEPGAGHAVTVRAKLPDGHWGAFTEPVEATAAP
ncbi:fibronectin type III domain-containing protein [Streptomyces lonarensis]|uniref:fibronectin type III domain-containing protein n=1 Tax=Streptomyces lonarensis TaxID=700599 RepID=UPI0028A7007F|nr:fibronectin type III domain-containing protein [Streptomyces lonarensis]